MIILGVCSSNNVAFKIKKICLIIFFLVWHFLGCLFGTISLPAPGNSIHMNLGGQLTLFHFIPKHTLVLNSSALHNASETSGNSEESNRLPS